MANYIDQEGVDIHPRLAEKNLIIKQRDAEIARLTKANQDLGEVNLEFHKRIESLTADNPPDIMEVWADVDALRQQNNTLRTQVDDLESKLMSLYADRDAAREEAADLRRHGSIEHAAQVADMKRTILTLEAQQRTDEKERAQVMSANENLEKAAKTLLDERDAANLIVSELRHVVGAELVESLQTRHNEVIEEMQRLTKLVVNAMHVNVDQPQSARDIVDNVTMPEPEGIPDR